ncbi:MAG TPA: DUF6335 family protein [Coleofasciculaceae cyanobacterium]
MADINDRPDNQVAEIPDEPVTSTGNLGETYGEAKQAVTPGRAVEISDTPVDDSDESPIISDLPQEITESYGTGVELEPGLNSGGRTMRDRMEEYTSTSPELTGGDVDARWDQADSVGDEAVGGTVATPDQNVVEDLGVAVGLEYDDRVFLRTNDILEERDDRRWELDPSSSEDYPERREKG